MAKLLILSNFDKMFQFSSTISIVMFIVSALFSLSIIAGIILGVVRIYKGVKNGTIKLEDLPRDKESGFKTCEYCGSSNKKEHSTCEKCGASLNRK